MTVAHPHIAARGRARAPAAAHVRPVNWAAIGVIGAIFMHLAAGVWFAATLSARVHAIEAELPPGSIQKLQGQVDQIQRDLERRR